MAAAPPLRLGGTDDRPALTVGGRTWTYRQLAGLVEEQQSLILASRANGATPPHLVASGLPIVAALALLFAGAAEGVPVLLADPVGPSPDLGPLPPGTFLIAVTSGTSGRPRPVLRTAASWTASFAPLTEIAGLGPDDRVLLTGPLHATMHLFAAVHTLALGAQLTDRPDVATAVHAVPAVLEDLVAARPPALRTAVVAGAALSHELGELAGDNGIAVTEYYGAAELSFVAVRRFPAPLQAFPGAEIDLRPASSPTRQLAIDDAPAGQPPGELWVRSPYLATGYAAEVAGPLHRTADGFATVGDLADRTADGGLRIRGRGNAAITTGGATVVAEDVEDAVGRLPGVLAVAVVGVPHARLGEIVTAVIEPVPGAVLTGLRDTARTVLRGPSLPRRWLVADRLPRTAGGKVARHPVAQAAAQFAAGDPPARASAPGEQDDAQRTPGEQRTSGEQRTPGEQLTAGEHSTFGEQGDGGQVVGPLNLRPLA